MARVTTDHDEIRQWVEARGGHPARVIETGSGRDPGILRIDFPGYSGEETLEAIDWEEFFEWLDRDRLAMLLDDGANSRFNKFVSRSTAAKKRAPAKKRSASAKKTSSSTKRPAAKKAAAKKRAPAKKTAAKKSSKKPAKKSSKKSSKKSTKRGRR